jgi:hypothetical protein
MLGALLLALSLTACGSGRSSGARVGAPTTITDTAAVSPIATGCASAALRALEQVAYRVYRESASGRIIAEAIQRLRSSRALGQAVEGDDPAATLRVLRSLLLNQIVSVRVTRGGRTLARSNGARGSRRQAGRS